MTEKDTRTISLKYIIIHNLACLKSPKAPERPNLLKSSNLHPWFSQS